VIAPFARNPLLVTALAPVATGAFRAGESDKRGNQQSGPDSVAFRTKPSYAGWLSHATTFDSGIDAEIC
jgi:hypothetical protein